MGVLGTFERGRRFTKADYRDTGIPSLHYADIYTKYDLATDRADAYVREDMEMSLRYASKGDLVIACTGETKDDIAKAIVWEGDCPVAVHDDCYIFRLNAAVLPRFVSYCFQANWFQALKKRLSTEGKNVRISKERLASIEIPVLSLEDQECIVAILDRFDALTTSLADGLPAEIKARRQQYEYYRDRLLNFPRKKTVA